MISFTRAPAILASIDNMVKILFFGGIFLEIAQMNSDGSLGIQGLFPS